MAYFDKSYKVQLAEELFTINFHLDTENLCSQFPVFQSYTSYHPNQSSFF